MKIKIIFFPGYVEGFTGNGFTSLAITYASFTITNWFAPPIVSYMGPRLTLVFGSIFYILYVAQISYPNNMLLYACSGLLGFGGALLWVAQGNFLTLNSTSETMERNSGYFFAIFQSSQVWGNIFVFFQLQNVDDIDYETRLTVSKIG